MKDFMDACEGELVLHCLPEGAIAAYPADVYREMRGREPRPAEKAAESIVFRRMLRRFGSMSQPETLSQQGRITIPQMFRESTGVVPGAELVVVGIEIGVEIWTVERWNEELRRIGSHSMEKAEREMQADLVIREKEE